MSKKYDHKKIERKWQEVWEKTGIFKTPDKLDKKNEYVLDFFPYPSGEGLHVGHLKGYSATDIYAHLKRRQGFNVLHPMGWDAFGLPAENFAIKKGIHPAVTTARNINLSKEHLKRMGFSYDWNREINTTDPEYYKWTQWIFIKLFKKGLAYEAEMPINWCPSCKTGLANEEVVGGVCERCGTEITKKNLRQWVLKITAYADRLLSDLDDLDWPEPIKLMQKNWIGKSIGTEIDFLLDNGKKISVFTTRIDTIFSGTFVILAPEHPLVSEIVTADHKKEVEKYIEATKKKSEIERTAEDKDKSGIFTGIYAQNPATGEKIQVWVADFVLLGYGTGAVFADAHDERDFEMAKKYDLPLKVSIKPDNPKLWNKVKKLEEPYTGDGTLVNSEQFDGLTSQEAREKITNWLSKKGLATKKVNYKLRDWLFSRQRYWGEPIPIIHCEKCASTGSAQDGLVPMPEKELPLKLPDVKKYKPTGTGESPLAAITDWVNTTCPKCGSPGKRETNTMPQWAGSCWYYIRFIDPKNDKTLADKNKMKQWLPVDFYVGGAEHAVLHLLYARFWHKFLYDIGVVPTKEPFQKLRNVGLIVAEDGGKMSKSRGNFVSPDEVMDKYGADALKMYEMFMGPFEQTANWNTKSLEGIWRFLFRVWNLFEGKIEETEPDLAEGRFLNKTIKKVGEDIEKFRFNTAISALMILVNGLSSKKVQNKKALEFLILLLAPFAPHMSEELWEKLGNKESVHIQEWPKYDPKMLEEDIAIIVVQINGKVRANIEMLKGADQKTVEKEALANENIQKHLGGSKPKKIIYVPGKILNIVA